MASIDLTPWSVAPHAILQEGERGLLLTPPVSGGQSPRMHWLHGGDLAQPFDSDSLPAVTRAERLEEVERPAVALCVIGHGSGCGLVALFATAWELLAPAGRFYLLHPEWGSEGRAASAGQEQRLLALVQRCAFRHLGQRGDAAGRRLDEFVRVQDQRWRVGHACEHNREALRGLFRLAFGHDISEALWDWKYAQGRGCGTVVWRGDQLVAHYGVISRPVRLLGSDARVWLVGDVMVEPRERAAFTKKGPFFLAASSCNDACLAFDPKHRIGVGFPNSRHMRLAERTGVYTEVGRITELTWDLGTTMPSRQPRRVALRAQAGVLQKWIVARLWRRMDRDLADGVVIRRDWEYLLQRYLHHPEIEYRVFLVGGRFGLADRGVVVLRPQGERWELTDLIGPLRQVPLMVEAAKAAVREGGGTSLGAWMGAGYVEHFLPTGCRESDPDVVIPTSSWVPGPDPERLRDRWWLTYGDTDFH